MDGRWSEPAVGVALVIALGALVLAPGWVLDLGMVAMAAWVTWWISVCDLRRLRSPRGLPRLSVFGFLGMGIAANLATVRFFDVRGIGRLGLTVSLMLLAFAFALGLARLATSGSVRRP